MDRRSAFADRTLAGLPADGAPTTVVGPRLFRLHPVLAAEANLVLHITGDRIITEKVVMALLGATTVQVGVIAGVMARHLFPGRRP